ncbi:MAG: Asp-tRNA(Asn)/Glu-tRNA(Gln) amidotransferase subunit GatC [Patescibacteria group bacterium]
MSKISKDDVLRLAKLSNIYIDESQIDTFVHELEEIIGYVEMLGDVDVAGLEPTQQVTGLKNIMRPDEEVDYGVTPKDLLRNAPAQEKNQIKVKRVL